MIFEIIKNLSIEEKSLIKWLAKKQRATPKSECLFIDSIQYSLINKKIITLEQMGFLNRKNQTYEKRSVLILTKLGQKINKNL